MKVKLISKIKDTFSVKPEEKTEEPQLSEPAAHTGKKNLIPFTALLKEAQEWVSKNYAILLADDMHKEQLKIYLKQYMLDNNYYVEEMNITEVIAKLYSEMAEHSILTPLLLRKDIEEINVNAWNDIAIITNKGETIKLQEHFNSPEHWIDVLRRLLHKSGIIIDDSRPVVTGHLSSKIRISALYSSVVDPDRGASASIRIVNPSKIAKEGFIQRDMATEEMLDFLQASLNYGLSQCMVGATSSGKTTLMSWILSTVPFVKRIFTIEKEVREFNLVEKNEDGRILNNVIHTCTRPSDDKSRDIPTVKLVVAALTMHPDIICMAETKEEEEAWQAVEAANTGHTVITTTHSGSCSKAYLRLASLCSQRSHQDFNVILPLVLEAFPICVFTKKLEDSSRHIMEIAEFIDIDNGRPVLNTLYKYVVENEIADENGDIVKIIGQFVKANGISENLQNRLRENGMPRKMIERFARK